MFEVFHNKIMVGGEEFQQKQTLSFSSSRDINKLVSDIHSMDICSKDTVCKLLKIASQ